MTGYLDDVNKFWEELSEEERQAIRDKRRKNTQKMLLDCEQDTIELNKGLIKTMKQIIYKRIHKDNYSEIDQRIVELALKITQSSEKEIKKAEREILLLTRYPVGSKHRPNIALLKEVK